MITDLEPDILECEVKWALESITTNKLVEVMEFQALRGCIGEIMPMRPLVEAVAARAVDSALGDPRFSPVSERELGGIRVEVSALTPPKRVASWKDIVLGRDGMTLEKNGCFAVFLPQVAPEQGRDLATTLSYLSKKAGLDADAWRKGAIFETFQAEVFHE